MSKKFFTILLLAVFMLAQFGAASAAQVAGTVTIDALPIFHVDGIIDIDYSIVDMDAGDKYIYLWARFQNDPAGLWSSYCEPVTSATGASVSGATSWDTNFYGDQAVVEFYMTVDSAVDCATATSPSTASPAMTSTFIDAYGLDGFVANPPYSVTDGKYSFSYQHVACNTFEMWALATDNLAYLGPAVPVEDYAYSGFGSWNQNAYESVTRSPAPIGPENALLSWPYTFLSTDSGYWSFTVDPEDVAGNVSYAPEFRYELEIYPSERLDCATFSDISGHADELYIRYLATLGLINGNSDGTFGPDNTLTRAEAAVLFEISNGFDVTSLPLSAPVGCEFTDVSATDWFAGWVWQACADGFMNGLGEGLFGPSDLLTRGQIVTIMNNIANLVFLLKAQAPTAPSLYSGYLATCNPITCPWGLLYREAAWTDVFIGDYYAEPIMNAYAVGVVDGTSATTFSPDQPVTRGEFAKMLYRGLSVVAPIYDGGCGKDSAFAKTGYSGLCIKEVIPLK